MRINLFFLWLFFVGSVYGVADTSPLGMRVQNFERFQTKVFQHCSAGKLDLTTFSIQIDGKKMNCLELLSIVKRLKDKIDREIDALEASNCNPETGNTIINQTARESAQLARSSVSCKPKSQDAFCMGAAACAIGAVVNPIGGILAQAAVALGSKNQCANTGNNCLQEIFRGIINDLWGSIKGLGELALMGLEGVGNLLYNGATRFGEWTGILAKHELTTSQKLMAAQQSGPGFVRQFLTHPVDTMKALASSMWAGLKKAAMETYGCEEWQGPRLGPNSVCLKKMGDWNCATCNQKVQVICGVGGMAIGEIATAFFTGGLAAGAKFLAGPLIRAVKVGAEAVKLGRSGTFVANKTRQLAEAFSHLPKSPPGLKVAVTGVVDATRTGLSRGQRLVIDNWNKVANSRSAEILANATRAASSSPLGSGVRFVANAPIKTVGAYLEALNRATELGYELGNTGINAIRTARSAEIVGATIEASGTGRIVTEGSITPGKGTITPANAANDNAITRVAANDNVPTRVSANDNSLIVGSTPEVAPINPSTIGREGSVGFQPQAVTVRSDGISSISGRIAANDGANISGASVTRFITPAEKALPKLSAEATESLRQVGLDADELVRPAEVALTDEFATKNRLNEIEWTRADIDAKFAKWKANGTYDQIFDTLGKLTSDQEKKRYLAILLNSPDSEVVETLARLKTFPVAADTAGRTQYFSRIDKKVNDLDALKTLTEKQPISVARSEALDRIAHKRSALLQERTLLTSGDNVEIVSFFSSRASNDAFLKKGYNPHSLEDTFSVDLKIKNDVSVCRGSFAGLGSLSSQLTGGFTTFCRDSGYAGRNPLSQFVAGPGDKTRIGKATAGYERFHRYGLKDGDRISLGLNGPVTYTDAAQFGTGGRGGGIELFTYRSPTNPVTLDRLEGSIRIPSCERANCDRIFAIQEEVRGANLTEKSDPARFLDDAQRRTQGIIVGLNPRIEEYARAVANSGGDVNLLRLKEDFPDVRSAFNLRREIELKNEAGFTFGGATRLDSETLALRTYTQDAEKLGADVATALRRDGITDPVAIERAYQEAIDSSPLVVAHLENQRIIRETLERLKAPNLTAAQRNELLYELSKRAGQEEDIALAFKTLDYQTKTKIAKSGLGGSEDAAKAISGRVSTYIRDLQQNGLGHDIALPFGRNTDGTARVLSKDLIKAAGYTDPQRVAAAETVIRDLSGRPLTKIQKDAILQAHDVGAGTGRGFFTYTRQELVEKRNILRQAGFSDPEALALLQKGIAGELPAAAGASRTVARVEPLDRSDAISATNAANKEFDLLETRLRKIRPETLATMSEADQIAARAAVRESRAAIKEKYLEAGEGFANAGAELISEGNRGLGLQNVTNSITAYTRAGSPEKALTEIRFGISKGMTPQGVIDGIQVRKAEFDRALLAKPNDPILLAQQKTAAQIISDLRTEFRIPDPAARVAPTTARPATAVRPTDAPTTASNPSLQVSRAPASPPQVAQPVPVVEPVTPTPVIDAPVAPEVAAPPTPFRAPDGTPRNRILDEATNYRLGINGKTKDPTKAAGLFYQAERESIRTEAIREIRSGTGETKFFDNKLYDAFSMSMEGDGTVARAIIDDVFKAGGETKGNHLVNLMINEIEQRQLSTYKTVEARKNMMALGRYVQDTYGSGFYTQAQVVRRWITHNDW